METGLLVFVIWLMLAAVGVAASIKKRAQKTDRTLNQKAAREEEAEQRIRDYYERMRQESPGQQQTQESLEDPDAEALLKASSPRPQPTPAPEPKPAAQPAPEPVKKREMDFDAEEMVIYSEIMKPGYEKY